MYFGFVLSLSWFYCYRSLIWLFVLSMVFAISVVLLKASYFFVNSFFLSSDDKHATKWSDCTENWLFNAVSAVPNVSPLSAKVSKVSWVPDPTGCNRIFFFLVASVMPYASMQ